MIKLAVGVRDVAHLTALQAARAAQNPPLRHRTRSFPKRAEELLDGGSIYWVVDGIVSVRQGLADIVRETEADGRAMTALVLDPRLSLVAPRPMRAFQGWRYLEDRDAPEDLAAGSASAEMPAEMRRQLAALGLL